MNDEAEVWAIVELMGHVRLAGKLSEIERYGSKLARLDIPIKVACGLTGSAAHTTTPDTCPQCHGAGTTDGFKTELFGAAAVYRIHFVTEAVARHVAKSCTTASVSAWDFPKQLTHQEAARHDDGGADFGQDDDEDDEP